MKTQLIKGLLSLALVGLSTLSFSADHESTAKHSISKELVKQTTASGVTTFDWVIKYENLSGGILKDVEIKDTFSSNQSYVPSSEQHPDGWNASQSGNTIQWNAGLVGDGGYSRPFSPIPTSGFNIPSGGEGDGWAPIPYNAPNGDFRIYYINHHKVKSFPSFGCVGACTSSTWPKKLPEGDPNGSETTSTPNNVKTAIVNNKLYYSVTRNPGAATVVAQDWGVGCYNLIDDTECGYTPLSTNPNSRSITLGIDGPYEVGNKLYFLDSDLFVHCFDPSGSNACGSHDLKTSTTMGVIGDSSLIPKGGTDNYGNRVGAHVDGDKIYFDIGNDSTILRPTGGKVVCFDTSGMSRCSGWADAVISSREDIGYNAYFHRNTAGVPTHICTNSKGLPATLPLTKECFKLANGAVDNTLPDMVVSAYLATINSDLPMMLMSDLYVPSENKTFFISSHSNRNVFCYNWTTSSVCTIDKIASNLTNASGYAQAIDGNGCAWVLGHENQLWSYDPETSETPCQKEEFSFESTFDPSKNWCATEDPQWSYTQFRIDNIRASDFEELIIEFLDTNGNIIKTLDATGAMSISQGLFTAPFTAGDPIHYRIKVKLASGVTEYTTLPVVTIGVDGPPQEFCLSTTVECPNTEPVVNSVTASVSNNDEGPVIGGESIPDVSDEVTIDAESTCKDIVIDPPEPKSCLVIEPKLECVKGKGWQVSFTNSTSGFNPTDLDITSLTTGVTVVGNSPSWTLSGATPNSIVKLSANGVIKNGGSEKGTDLCCASDVDVEIPDEQCEIASEKPHIYTRKSFEETENGQGVFHFILDSWVQLKAPTVLKVTDTIPAGVTLTSLDSANVTNWSCPGMPITGPGALVCTYIGTMPIPAGAHFNISVFADIEASEEARQNCIETNLVDTDGTGIPYDGVTRSCADIPADDPEVVCAEGEVLVEGACVTQPDNEPDVPLACNSNIVIVADESGSIAEANAQWTVQNAIRSFAKGFKGHGSKAAVIHFDTNATLEKSMTEIATSSGQENDFDNNYAPVSGYTNWEAGLKLALAEVTTTPGSIVFFITDGQPNRYLDNSGNVQTGTEAQSVAEAVAVANLIKAAGSRIIAIGVGDITGSPNAQTNLNSIASSSGDTIVDDINNLNQIAVDYSTQACPDVYLSKRTVKNKNINLATGNLNTNKPEFLITVTNNTTTALTGITVQDALPIPKLTFNAFSAGSPSVGISSQTANVITWSGISLAPAASATLKFSANVAMQAGEKVYNYAEVTAVDQTVSSVNPLADPMAGPLNADDKDEGKDYVYVYDYISTPCAATSENPDKCLYIRKEIIKTEGACLPGAVCKYKITIRNGSTQAYTSPLAISDVYTPNTSVNITSITASGGAPASMCSPNPTSIPFSCLQNTDLPANTTWTYIIETIAPTSGVDKNCLTVNSKTSCAMHPSTKSLQIVTKPDEETLIVDKFAPRTCEAGSKCKFTFTITNKTKKLYSGFVGITDKPRKRFGRIRGKSKGWSCKKKGREYRCDIDELSLNPAESKKLTLTLQVPRSLSGKVENCAIIEAESPVSPKSCVTVEIINNRQCGYDDKLVNGRCVARCKSKNSNWNGVDCMVCSGGKTWNDRYKRCEKKPKDVIKSCPDHYRWSTAQKRCIYVVPRPTTKTCNKGTHYDARKKRCVENARPQKCNKGTHYNVAKKRCVEDRRSHPVGCPAGQIYLSDVKRCVKVVKEKPKRGGGGGCGSGEIWNIIYKKCEKLPEYDGSGGDGGHTGGGGGYP